VPLCLSGNFTPKRGIDPFQARLRSRTGGFASPTRPATLISFRSAGMTRLRHRRPSFPLWPPWRQVTLFIGPRIPPGAGALWFKFLRTQPRPETEFHHQDTKTQRNQKQT
jgi:hypothetical protein